MKILVLFQLKWIKKLIVCKNSSNLITINKNLQQQEKPEFYSGFGKIMKEVLSYIHHKFQQKRL
jgi:hypothetical protein